MPAIEGLTLVLIVAALAAVVGVGFGIVLAPRITRLLDRADAPEHEDEEPG